MGGFFPEKIKASFQIPEGYEPTTAFVIGYLGNPDMLPESYRKHEFKKTEKKELGDIVFQAWEQPAAL
jgi:hypothetical protein